MGCVSVSVRVCVCVCVCWLGQQRRAELTRDRSLVIAKGDGVWWWVVGEGVELGVELGVVVGGGEGFPRVTLCLGSRGRIENATA